MSVCVFDVAWVECGVVVYIFNGHGRLAVCLEFQYETKFSFGRSHLTYDFRVILNLVLTK